jgi:splicing factor 3B subunit 3
MADSSSGGTTLYLHIGLYSGVYLRTVLDEVTGELSDTRTRFLGAKPVKLFRVSVKGQTAVLALSSRPWLGYSDIQTKGFMLTPLDYVGLEWGWNFSSEQCVEGMVGIQAQNLRYVHHSPLSCLLLRDRMMRTLIRKVHVDHLLKFISPIVPTEITATYTFQMSNNVLLDTFD